MTYQTLNQLLPEGVLNEMQKEIASGDTPLWQHWGEFVIKYLRTGRSISTVTNVRDTLRFIIRRLKINTIEKCNSPRFLDDRLHEEKLSSRFSNTTFNTYLKGLNTYFIWLEQNGYIEKNMIRKVSRCKEEHREQLTLTDEQINLVILQLHKRKQKPLERARNIFMIDLLRFSGARPCELLQLKVADIIHTGNTSKLRISGAKQKGKVRYYKMPSSIKDSYDNYMFRRNKYRVAEQSLFVSLSKRSGWTYKGFQSFLKRLSREVGFQVTAYGFRRYVATTLYLQTPEIKYVSDYLGHTRPSTTLSYVNSICARTDLAGKIMEKHLLHGAT